MGCKNGRVLIYDFNSLKQVNAFLKEVNPDKEILSLVKFGPQNDVFAVAYAPPLSYIQLF